MDQQLNEVLTRAKQALQQAQANPAGAQQALQGAYDELQRVINEGGGQNLDTLYSLSNSLEHACNAAKEPNNLHPIQNSFEQAIRACEQAQQELC